MLVGNNKSCESCVKKDVCKYASTRQAVLNALEGSLDNMNVEEMPFVVSLSCNSFSNEVTIRERGM